MSILENLTPLAVWPQDDRLKRFDIVCLNEKTSPGAGKVVIAENIRQEEVAQRIVACVNACAGVETERLEDGMLVKEVHKTMLRNMGDRYQLLVALEALILFTKPSKSNAAALSNAYAAIAAAKGGAA